MWWTIFSFVLYIIVAIFIAIGLFALIVGFKVIMLFNFRYCKHCNHSLDYKGMIEDKDHDYYLFRCPKCGAWEKIPKEEFICECDKDCNPNTL